MTAFVQCQQAITKAPNERAVRAALMECISQVQDLIAGLPAECREILASPMADLSDAAITLLQADLRYQGDPDNGRILHRMANVYASAAVRVTQLHERSDAG